jgi:CRP-like cAMP-binding protein
MAPGDKNEKSSLMRNPWLMKMEQFTPFSEEERRLLDALVSQRRHEHAAGEDILREGDHSPDCHVILSGLACRYKILPDGERQIMAFLVPGDLCDAEIFILKTMDHSVGTLTPTTTASVPGDIISDMVRSSGALSAAMWWGTLTDLAVLRERIIDHGRRDAHERVAHLLYELLVRYRMVGLARDNAIEFPMTQVDLADATGMTSVHVNRMLQKLRQDGLISLSGKILTVLDPDRLKEVAGFNASYLHLDRAHDRRDGISERAGDLV